MIRPKHRYRRRRPRRSSKMDYSRRGRCGFRAFLVDLDERLVQHRRDKQGILIGRCEAVDSGKIGLPRKRLSHAERGERFVEFKGSPGELEARKKPLDLLPAASPHAI